VDPTTVSTTASSSTSSKAPPSGSGGGGAAYNPQSLLSAVCCHAPQFRGRQQHDSHELLRILVDGLQVRGALGSGVWGVGVGVWSGNL
jgi:hypothetical protein